jgi:hypothetical protein
MPRQKTLGLEVGVAPGTGPWGDIFIAERVKDLVLTRDANAKRGTLIADHWRPAQHCPAPTTPVPLAWLDSRSEHHRPALDTYLPVWLSSTRGNDAWSSSRPSTCPQHLSRGRVPARRVPLQRRLSAPPMSRRSSMAPVPAPESSLPPAPRPSTARRQTWVSPETESESEPHPYARRPRPTMSSMILSSSRYVCPKAPGVSIELLLIHVLAASCSFDVQAAHPAPLDAPPTRPTPAVRP